MKTAFLFPGQGAQYAGMGHDFYDHFPEARFVFDQAAAVLGPEFLEVIFSGPEEKLKQTENTQPAILTVSVAIFRVLESLGLNAAILAGLSLGEYSALVAAGVISFKEALPLVQKRGIYMQEAVPLGQGLMVAIMGLSHNTVEQVCHTARSKGLVAPANYSCPGQIVISGYFAAVKLAVDLAREAGAKKITELKVSAPFHCALLQPVENILACELDKIEIKKPSVPVVFNVTAKFADSHDQIKLNLVRQVSNPILWEQSVHTLLASGINSFIGIGPGNSLSRLMKRIAPEVETFSVEDVKAVEQLFE
ncbi:MAG: ACP S-malonyltransferase [Clostridia bacterium]|nr:ACP S-malonyltransferase [Clostridia bacterium]